MSHSIGLASCSPGFAPLIPFDLPDALVGRAGFWPRFSPVSLRLLHLLCSVFFLFFFYSLVSPSYYHAVSLFRSLCSSRHCGALFLRFEWTLVVLPVHPARVNWCEDASVILFPLPTSKKLLFSLAPRRDVGLIKNRDADDDCGERDGRNSDGKYTKKSYRFTRASVSFGSIDGPATGLIHFRQKPSVSAARDTHSSESSPPGTRGASRRAGNGAPVSPLGLSRSLARTQNPGHRRGARSSAARNKWIHALSYLPMRFARPSALSPLPATFPAPVTQSIKGQ